MYLPLCQIISFVVLFICVGASQLMGQFSSPTAVDVNGDDRLDVLYSSWDENGEVVFKAFIQLRDGTFESDIEDLDVDSDRFSLFPNPSFSADGTMAIASGALEGSLSVFIDAESQWSDLLALWVEDFQYEGFGFKWLGRLEIGADASDAALADLNADGFLDVIWGNYEGEVLTLRVQLTTALNKLGDGGNLIVAGNRVKTLFRNEKRLFATPTTCDMNGDGLLDLIVGSEKEGLGLHLNKGSENVPKFVAEPDVHPAFEEMNKYILQRGLTKVNPSAANFYGDDDEPNNKMPSCKTIVVGSAEGILIFFELGEAQKKLIEANELISFEDIEEMRQGIGWNDDVMTSSPTPGPTCACPPGWIKVSEPGQLNTAEKFIISTQKKMCASCAPCKIGYAEILPGTCTQCGYAYTGGVVKQKTFEDTALTYCGEVGLTAPINRQRCTATIAAALTTIDGRIPVGKNLLGPAWSRNADVECPKLVATSKTKLQVSASKPSTAFAVLTLRNPSPGMPVSFYYEDSGYTWTAVDRVRSLGSTNVDTVIIGRNVWFHVPASGEVQVQIAIQTSALADGLNTATPKLRYADLLWGNGLKKVSGFVELQIEVIATTGSLLALTSSLVETSLPVDNSVTIDNALAIFARSPFATQWEATVSSEPDAKTGVDPSKWLRITPSSGSLNSQYTCSGEITCAAVQNEEAKKQGSDQVTLKFRFDSNDLPSSAYFTTTVSINARTGGQVLQTEKIQVEMRVTAGVVSIEHSTFVLIPGGTVSDDYEAECYRDYPKANGRINTVPAGPIPPLWCFVPRDRNGVPVTARRDLGSTAYDKIWENWNDSITVTITPQVASINGPLRWDFTEMLSQRATPPFVVEHLSSTSMLANGSYTLTANVEFDNMVTSMSTKSGAADLLLVVPAVCGTNEESLSSSGYTSCICKRGYGRPTDFTDAPCSTCKPGTFYAGSAGIDPQPSDSCEQ